jgi:hypothetical protein
MKNLAFIPISFLASLILLVGLASCSRSTPTPIVLVVTATSIPPTSTSTRTPTPMATSTSTSTPIPTLQDKLLGSWLANVNNVNVIATYYPDGKLLFIAAGDQKINYNYKIIDQETVEFTPVSGDISTDKIYINGNTMTDVSKDGVASVMTKISSTSTTDKTGQILQADILGSWQGTTSSSSGNILTFSPDGKGIISKAGNNSDTTFTYKVIDGETVEVTIADQLGSFKFYINGDKMTMDNNGDISFSARVKSDTSVGQSTTQPSTTGVPNTPVAQSTTQSSTKQSPTTQSSTTGTSMYFKEEFSAAPDNWSVLLFNGNGSDFSPSVDNGMLTYNIPKTTLEAASVYAPQIYKDVRIDASADNRGGSDNSFNFFCRYDQNLGWYEFAISSTGQYAIKFGQWKSGTGSAAYDKLYDGATYAIHEGTNRFAIVCSGNSLSLYINDLLVKTVGAELGPQEGLVGMGATAGKFVPAIIDYDWVQISKP